MGLTDVGYESSRGQAVKVSGKFTESPQTSRERLPDPTRCGELSEQSERAAQRKGAKKKDEYSF